MVEISKFFHVQAKFHGKGENGWYRVKNAIFGCLSHFLAPEPPKFTVGTYVNVVWTYIMSFGGVGGKKVPFWPKNGISGSVGGPNIHFWQFKPNFAS